MKEYESDTKLTTDPELEFLKHDFSGRLMMELEADIRRNGCTEPILICGNIIVDGSKRYQICCKNGYAFSVEQVSLSFAECIAYVCLMQLKRKDLPMEMSRYLAGRYFQAMAAPSQPKHIPNKMETYSPRYTHSFSKIRTAKEIGPDLKLAAATMLKYDTLAQHIDVIRASCPELAMKLLSDTLFVAYDNVRELSHLPKEDLYRLNKTIDRDGRTRLTHAEIMHELRYRTNQRSGGSGRKPKKEPPPAIRDMPKYDPDSEISSLALTIPSWISSIARANEKTDFASTTQKAREVLLEQLLRLDAGIRTIEKSLREDSASEE